MRRLTGTPCASRSGLPLYGQADGQRGGGSPSPIRGAFRSLSPRPKYSPAPSLGSNALFEDEAASAHPGKSRSCEHRTRGGDRLNVASVTTSRDRRFCNRASPPGSAADRQRLARGPLTATRRAWLVPRSGVDAEVAQRWLVAKSGYPRTLDQPFAQSLWLAAQPPRSCCVFSWTWGEVDSWPADPWG